MTTLHRPDPPGPLSGPGLSGPGLSGPGLIIFARTPRAGEAKTRLSPPLSLAEAARVYEASLHDTVQIARRVPANVSIRFHDPSGDDAYFAAHFSDISRAAQCAGDLGARIAHGFDQGFLGGHDPIAIMGSDSPTLPLDHLSEGIERLATSDVTLGPAYDGGYYLVGIRRAAWPLASRLFDGIEWSSDHVLADTLDRAQSLSLRVSLLPTWYDIDTVADLERARADASGGRLAALLEQLDFAAPAGSSHPPGKGPL